ncbi:glycosyltransferase [Sphingobium aromaticiconvertens]|uniref:glycosyltransferase n=1 Tax=Sphingobium aromaticiconvertens TaxID=365341 RepID=UPI0030165478
MGQAVAIFAHQEEQRIAACLASLPLDRPDTVFHVLINGSTDQTGARAKAAAGGRPHVVIHDLHPGGKSRTWNHMVHTLLTGRESAVIFLDGDARIAPGSVDALIAALEADPSVNAAAGMPLNGRQADQYRQSLREERGLFGDLYALSGSFLSAIRAQRLRLPTDLIGDDGLVAAWAHTNLQTDAHWSRERVIACEEAGFLCDPVSLLHPASWSMQYRRMVNYSVRFFQNRIISDIMAKEGPTGLPERLTDLYPAWLDQLSPRPGVIGWFDRRALARINTLLR